MSSRSGGNGGGGGGNISSVFYADSYHPIQSGSIDGTDTLPHDNGVYRALLCSQAGLYDAFGDPKVAGDPYCIVFVGHLSHLTTEETIHKVMSKYGKVKSLRLVRHIVTGASRGYAFVEFETEREMRRAYEEAHHTVIDDSKITVDYNRQQLMSGWIPRRLGGGLGGRKESGQLRFGGRERPFRAPLRPIPVEELKRLGISPPPEGRYMSRFQVPSPPRRKSVAVDEHKQHSSSRHDNEETTYQRSHDEEKTYRRSHDEHKQHSSSRHDNEEKTYQRSHDEEKTYQRSHDEHKQHSSSRHDNEEKTYQRSRDEKEHSGNRKHKHYKRPHDETSRSRSRSRSKRRSISQARHSSSD